MVAKRLKNPIEVMTVSMLQTKREMHIIKHILMGAADKCGLCFVSKCL